MATQAPIALKIRVVVWSSCSHGVGNIMRERETVWRGRGCALQREREKGLRLVKKKDRDSCSFAPFCVFDLKSEALGREGEKA